MNSDNFLLEEYDIEQAKDICKSIDIDSVRQRAVANALAGAIAIKYFSPELEIDIESGLYNIPQVLDNYEISDVYIKNNYIDVRLYFNENDLCVPKSHYENDLQPVAYMFIKLDEDISGATVTGFIPADAIDTSVSYDGYYRVNESELMSFCDIDSLLTEVYESECPDDINRRIFAFLEGDNESVVDFYRLLINSREARLRLKKAAKADLVFNYVSTVKTPEEFSSNGETNDDNTTVIIGESNDVEELLSLDGPIVNLENDELEFVDGSEPFLENDAISLDNLQEDMENVDFLESSESLELGR